MASQLYCAAEMLEGVVLNNGWKVIKKVPKSSTSTGGCFSVPYFVEKLEGKKRHFAFLKALNFRQLLAQPDITKAMEQHTRAFNFEKETLELCKGRKLKRIAHLIESGQYSPQNCPGLSPTLSLNLPMVAMHGTSLQNLVSLTSLGCLEPSMKYPSASNSYTAKGLRIRI